MKVLDALVARDRTSVPKPKSRNCTIGGDWWLPRIPERRHPRDSN